MKHAFPGDRAGTIRVRLSREKDGLIVLDIRDDGIGLPEGMDVWKTDTLGLGIIESLVDQVNGRLEIVRNGGTAFRISFREAAYPKRIPCV